MKVLFFILAIIIGWQLGQLQAHFQLQGQEAAHIAKHDKNHKECKKCFEGRNVEVKPRWWKN